MSFIDLTNSLRRLLLTLSFVFLMAVTSFGYTVVMRGGKQIEIPQHFTVTTRTVTYEVFPGINVTLQMSAIDIPATEKANNELPGSLLKRAEHSATESHAIAGAKPSSGQVIRTLTDRDLERYKRARRESEAAYERRRVELGLPSLEESRQRAAGESELFERELAERRDRERESENYWRARAVELRSEIAATDAQINFVRARLSEMPAAFSTGSCTVVTGGLFGFGPSAFSGPIHRPFNGIRRGPLGGQLSQAQIAAGRVPFGGGTPTGQVFVNPGTSFPLFHSGMAGSTFPGLLNSAVLVPPLLFGDLAEERFELVAWLDQLVANSFGLRARFRILEEEARRAGVPPGWLR